MVEPVGVGDAVRFVDAIGNPHVAVVTAVWGTFEHGDPSHGTAVPSLNVVYVSDDETKYDTYGRQILRETSVVHRSAQAAHGMFWDNL